MVTRLTSNGVPAKKSAGGKKSLMDGPENPESARSNGGVYFRGDRARGPLVVEVLFGRQSPSTTPPMVVVFIAKMQWLR